MKATPLSIAVEAIVTAPASGTCHLSLPVVRSSAYACASPFPKTTVSPSIAGVGISSPSV